MKKEIEHLQSNINSSDMSEVIVPIEDSIVDGVYTRIAYAKAGTIIIGCPHKKGGTAVLLSGSIRQIDGDIKYDISAPKIFNTNAGTQRSAYAVTDVIYCTMHSVESSTCEDAEKELFEQTPQITRIRNSFKSMLLECNMTEEDVDSEMESLPTYFETSDKYFVGDSIISGKGSIASTYIKKGEHISLAIKDGKRLPLARYVNHSDVPNARFLNMENGDIELVSIKHIPAGNEILVDYRERKLYE